MRVSTTKILAITAVLTLAGAMAATAQTPAQVRAEETRFRGMDADGDGNITRAEWRGSAASFRVHDWNNDGVLSGTEIRAAARRQQQQADDYSPTNFGYNDWSARGFMQLDANRDGRISAQEWHYDHEMFVRVDRNRNNFLSRAEFLDNQFDDDRGDQFDDLDVNGNNRVESAEWHGGANAFQWLDRNNDGALTRVEMVGTPARGRSQDQFTSLDINSDRAVSRTEWQWSPASFAALDRNNDGRLTRLEYEAGGPLGATGTSAKVAVNGFDRWTDTGIFVRTGDEVTFDATGKVQFALGADSAVEWTGAPGRLALTAQVPDLPVGHLIARIGNGAAMSAGGTIRATQDGRLYLGVNDDVLTDNFGTFQVTVTLRRP